MEAMTKCSQDERKIVIDSVWSGLEQTIKDQVEDVLVPTDQQTQGLHKELDARIGKMQLEL
jgi:hypothetical protein